VQFLQRLRNIATLETSFTSQPDKPTVTLNILEEDYSLRLPEKNSLILSFEGKTTFGKGEHVGTTTASKEYLDQTSFDEDLDFELDQWVQHLIELPQPEETTIESLMQDAFLAFEKAGYDVDLTPTPQNYLNVKLEFFPRQFKFRFPPAINKLLHLSEDYFFTDSIEIYLGKRASSPPKKKTKLEIKREDLLRKSIPNLLIVESDIVADSFFGKSVRPILKIFPRNSGYRFTHYIQFNPVEYRKVRVKVLSEINIKISTFNTALSPLSEILYPTTLTLHFKKHFGF